MNFVVGPILGILAVIDMKTKKIPVWPVLVMGVLLLFLRLLSGVMTKELVCGLIPGAVLLLVAKVTKEKIGIGDGLLLFCLGLGYRIEKIMIIVGVALAVAAVMSMVLIAVGKADRKTELPFLPFLFLGWAVSLFM